MPNNMRYLGQPDVLMLHVVSDGLIALAYLSIPFTLLYLVRKRPDRQFNWILICFAIFIIARGLTHLMEIWTIWHPAYWISGILEAITALVSVLIAILLIKLVPEALHLQGATTLRRVNLELEREICDRIRAEKTLQQANETLERRVDDRTSELEALNHALIHDNERFAIAADAAGLGFWSLDVAANKVKWDERMFELYGVSPSSEDQPFALWLTSLHPEDKERCERELADALTSASAYNTEFRVVHPNGTTHHLGAASRVARDGDGRAIQVFGVNFDITERKRADEQFRLAIDAAPTGMLLMNQTGSIVLANAQIENLFGYPRAELLGRQIEMLVPDRFRLHHPDYRKGFFSEPRTRAMGAGRDLYGLRKDGSEVPIEIGLNPLHTSDGDFVLSSIIDLSQRREIDRLRTDFVSTVSHELRTPLTSISGSLGLLQSGAMGALPEKAAAMVQIAYKNSGRLVRLINDILDIGRLESGELDLQMISVSLGALVQQSVEANFAYAEKYGVRFLFGDSSSGDRVMVDPSRLMQVITNLLSNAAKFSPSGTDVHIRIRPGPTTICIEVEDSGPGIPELFKSRIFEKFAQADASPARRFEGTGLGLSIARKLIEAMGGTIGFSTVAGRGTIFYLELPRTDAAPTVQQKIHLSESAAQEVLRSIAEAKGSETGIVLPRLLFIEDDCDLISMISATLGGRAEIMPAHSLGEAEALLRKERFDLVVLDQSMPDGNGIALLNRIPDLAEHSTPIVILSASDVPHEIGPKVTTVLLKSQMSAAQVAATILTYVSKPLL